ncbi:hypothetical protein V9T40_009120 [Parthenolecanium corni]|uniref:Uncharacterized protein n=1 Tax=Parthenolecanium corni TaxID=536013 RepID=A0AAN9TZ41_9HEMI
MVESNIAKGFGSNEKGKDEIFSITNGDLCKTSSSISESNSCNCGNSIEEPLYKHVYRKKTKWEMLRLSFTMMGIEIVYSSVTAFVSPILLMHGMSREQASMVWAGGPLIGLVLSPVLGSLSDRCKFSIGRRRPFIISLAFLDIVGLLLIANSNVIGKSLGDAETSIFAPNQTLLLEYAEVGIPVPSDRLASYCWTVLCIVVGAILVDFATDTILNPCRAYSLDVCIDEDHDKVLGMSMNLASLGGFIGYIISWIQWDSLKIGDIVLTYVQIVFYLVIFMFAICILITITTFREVPLKKASSSTISTESPESTEGKISWKDYLVSIIHMPKSLKILCVTNLLCWMSHVNFYLNFTHFVGAEVFQGNPSASQFSAHYQNYENGVRFGCIALSGNAVSSMVYSIIAPKVIDYFGVKKVYVGTILLDAVCLLAMALHKTKWFVIILSAMSGVIYCSTFTIPYMLVAHYHSKNMFDSNIKTNPRIRGLGTDLSIVGTCICVAQLINSLIMNQITAFFGVTFAIIGMSSILGFFAAVTATQISQTDSALSAPRGALRALCVNSQLLADKLAPPLVARWRPDGTPSLPPVLVYVSWSIVMRKFYRVNKA